MPTCPRCGKVNLKEALFCQDCGLRLDTGLEGGREPVPLTGGRPTCTRCSTVNDVGMNFCKMCGASLAASVTPVIAPVPPLPAVPTAPAMAVPSPAAASVVPTAAGAPSRQTCSACGEQTPAGFAFCQHCGMRLPAPASPPASVATAAPSVVAMPERPVAAPIPQAHSHSVASTAAEAAPAAASHKSEPKIVVPWGRLIVVRDGRDGAEHPLTGESFDIGRTEGGLVFGADSHLAPRHARIQRAGQTIKVWALDTVNGVYFKLRERYVLAAGDMILIGREVLRYEGLAPEEREPPSLVELGVRLLGSPTREAWGRLRQVTAAGTTRDIYHLALSEVVLGRNEGDLHFPDDELIAPRHAVLRRAGTRAELHDLGSTSGTFVRVRGERELRSGDILRLGEQTVRFEAP